jgi:hypothetical protein
MKRKISAIGTTSALAIFALAGTAFGQEARDRSTDSVITPTPQQGAAGHQAQSESDAREMAANFGVSELNDIENWKVTNAGEELGEIDRIAIDRASGELLAVVGLEGVVGLNMKEVGIPLSNLQTAGDETLSTDLSKEELQQQRDIDPWDGNYAQSLDEESLDEERVDEDAVR